MEPQLKSNAASDRQFDLEIRIRRVRVTVVRDGCHDHIEASSVAADCRLRSAESLLRANVSGLPDVPLLSEATRLARSLLETPEIAFRH
jgi:hypothetical protein